MMKTILSGIKQIFPPYLLLLVLFPLLSGLLVDFRLVNSRDFIIDIVWLSIFTVPAALINSRTVYRFAASLWFISGIIQLSHWMISKGPLTATSILVISNTNAAEAAEFMSLKAGFGLLILIPFLFVFILSLKYPPVYKHEHNRIWLMGLVFALSLVFIAENAINGRLLRKGFPMTAKAGFSFLDQIELYNEVSKDVFPVEVESVATEKACKQTYVLILDESASRRHMSLYGYHRNTNPLLSGRDDIIVFDNVVSPYSNTIQSVLSIFSESNLENPMGLDRSVDIIDVFYSAGFKTWWISNQPPMGIWENLVTVFANQSDVRIFVNTTTNSSMEATLTTSLDSKLFTPFKRALREDSEKKFIIIHLMGSHSAYNKRYPASYAKYKGKGKIERTRAEYDNSRLYNDFIVDSLLTILESETKSHSLHLSAAVCISDHGENVYDEYGRAGHDYSGTLPASNVEVPFYLWLSDDYLDTFPHKVKRMNNNVHMPFVADDLFHAIIDLTQIKTPYFQQKRSVFSEEYDSTRERILEDGKNYDD